MTLQNIKIVIIQYIQSKLCIDLQLLRAKAFCAILLPGDWGGDWARTPNLAMMMQVLYHFVTT